MKPGERPLHDPAVAAESLARLHPASRDSRGDASVSAGPSALPQPISWGSISQGMPLLRTKRMPVRAARSGTGGRPPFGLRRCFGSSDAIRAQPVAHQRRHHVSRLQRRDLTSSLRLRSC
jgi:hypothetical protein